MNPATPRFAVLILESGHDPAFALAQAPTAQMALEVVGKACLDQGRPQAHLAAAFSPADLRSVLQALEAPACVQPPAA